MQAYETKTRHMLDKTINDETVCLCATNSNYKLQDIAFFSNYEVRLYNFS